VLWPLVLTTAATLVSCSTASRIHPIAADASAIEDPMVVLPEYPELERSIDEPCQWPSDDPQAEARDYDCDTERRPRPHDVVFSQGYYFGSLVPHLDRLRELPWLCAAAVDDCHKGWRGRIANAARVYVAEKLRARAADAGWPWESYLAIVGGGTIGLAIGILIGWAAGL
jgi:hypothetical protein